MARPSTSHTALLLCTLTLSHLLCFSKALQFFLPARSKRCFREDIPLDTDVTLVYTIAQGSGTMPVTLRLTDLSGALVHERVAADHGAFRFRVPKAIPHVHEDANTWALRDDDRDEDDAGLLRAIPGAVGDNRLPYSLCFEHSSGALLRFPHLPSAVRNAAGGASDGSSGAGSGSGSDSGRGYGGPPRRRVIFNLKYGAQSRDQEFYDQLAKEKHLSSTEELFRVVEDRVGEIVRGVDEMRQRDLRMTHMTERTSGAVAGYSTLACVLIVAAAVYASSQTAQQLNKKKGR